jgi:recombination associated protein RdgC
LNFNRALKGKITMMFNNLAAFRLTEKFTLSAEALAEKLAVVQFQPCTGQQAFSMGWTAPVGENLVHESNDCMMICLKKEERLLPNSVVHEMLTERVEEIEEAEGRKLGKKAKQELKDNLIFELLPRAFTHSSNSFAYIDVKNDFIVINCASLGKAEDLLSTLRKTLGGLPAIPLNTALKPVLEMTNWLQHDITPNEFVIEDECELRAPEEGGSIARFKRHDLALPEIKNHLDTGKQVIKLALSWNDRISFLLDEHLKITRVKFLDLVQQQVSESETETDDEKFDVDFMIMSAEIAKFLPALIDAFGGAFYYLKLSEK